MMRKKCGFTLLEILVVVGILAILASMIIPSVSKGINKAKNARCLQNLKEIHKAVTIYSNEILNNNFFESYAPDIQDASFLKKYGGSSLSDLQCPFEEDTSFTGYRLNTNLVSGDKYRLAGKDVRFDAFITSNILLFETTGSASTTLSSRHNGRCYGVDIYGNLYRDLQNSDITLKT